MSHLLKLTTILFLFLVLFFFSAADPEIPVLSDTLWKYQCVDTVKYSRDAAREWGDRSDAAGLVNEQVRAIKKTGANCISIGTPYDEEFVPFLSLWVDAARQENLHVWFRGNMSSWEGWFGYPLYTSPLEHHADIYAFITAHPELFRKGDIFTPAPEAENGMLRNVWESEAKKEAFRNFLVGSYENCQKAMKRAGGRATCGYFSVNGDVAKSILTKEVVQKTGNVLVIDHYVKSAERLVADAEYLYEKYGAPVVLGEFGAPIPDIHGPLSETRQAQVVEEILAQVYQKRSFIEGLNYWTLLGGSTSLLNADGSEREVFKTIQKYYKPFMVEGVVTDTRGAELSGIRISIDGGRESIESDRNGNYQILTPGDTIEFTINADAYVPVSASFTGNEERRKYHDIVLEPKDPSLFYRFMLWLNSAK